MKIEEVRIETLLARLGIDAKRKAKEWVALCPNPAHEDRTPSWRIRDDPGATRHGYHHCWPCGFGGSVVDLVMALKGISDFRDAKKWIEDAGAIVEQNAAVVGSLEVQITPPQLRFRLPDEVTLKPIHEWPSLARDYWLKRGLEPWQVDRWGVGYAMQGRLKGRLVVVYRDPQGRPLRYTARTFIDEEKRYLEPDEHEKANPHTMFGEQHWPDLEEREEQILFVLEGAINGLALEAELPGVYFAATAGSEIRPLYAVKLSGWKKVVLMSDPDAAGDKVADALATSLSRHVPTARLRLPPGFDAGKLRELRPGELGSIVRSWLRSG